MGEVLGSILSLSNRKNWPFNGLSPLYLFIWRSLFCHDVISDKTYTICCTGMFYKGPSIEMLFQVFRLNFSWDMPKMHFFVTNFQKLPSAGALRSQRSLIFDFGDLKLRDVAKFFSRRLWQNRTSKIGYDVLLVTSWPLCHRKTSQNFSFLAPSQLKFLATPVFQSNAPILL